MYLQLPIHSKGVDKVEGVQPRVVMRLNRYDIDHDLTHLG